jgi:hypothetical protein
VLHGMKTQKHTLTAVVLTGHQMECRVPEFCTPSILTHCGHTSVNREKIAISLLETRTEKLVGRRRHRSEVTLKVNIYETE